MSRRRGNRSASAPPIGLKNAIADKLVFSKLKARFGGRVRFFISGSAALDRDVAQWFDAVGTVVLEGFDEAVPIGPPPARESYLDIARVVAAMRGSVMTEADLVVTVGRRLDFQLAYGSPAVFGDAKFVHLYRDGRDVAASLRRMPWMRLAIRIHSRWKHA